MGIPIDVIERAAKQGGYVTRAQLLGAGLSPSMIDRRVSRGDFASTADGVYRVIPTRDQYDLVRGALLALPRAVVSHESAAHLLTFPRLPRANPTVTVASQTTHRFPGVMVRRCDDLVPGHLTTVDRLPVTNVARTAFDLAGVLSYAEFDEIGEALILSGRMEMRHFERITAALARPGKRGSQAARDFIGIRSRTDPRSTSLERKGRAVLASAGLPKPLAQFPLPWSPARRFDDGYPEARLAIEWDSRSWHQRRAEMASDRRRDRDAATHGWVVVRFTWEDLTQSPEEVVSTVALLLRDRSPDHGDYPSPATQGSRPR